MSRTVLAPGSQDGFEGLLVGHLGHLPSNIPDIVFVMHLARVLALWERPTIPGFWADDPAFRADFASDPAVFPRISLALDCVVT
jgi:hypothetical protein